MQEETRVPIAHAVALLSAHAGRKVRLVSYAGERERLCARGFLGEATVQDEGGVLVTTDDVRVAVAGKTAAIRSDGSIVLDDLVVTVQR